MKDTRDLLQAAKDPRLASQPKWIQALVGDLAYQLRLTDAQLTSVRERAEAEVEAARKLLSEGPEGSDTFMPLPHSSVADGYGDEERPLGQGTAIEFRPADGTGREPGEGFTVQLTEGRVLKVTSISAITLSPRDTHTVLIEEIGS